MKSVKDDVVTCYCRFHLMRESRWFVWHGNFIRCDTNEDSETKFLPSFSKYREKLEWKNSWCVKRETKQLTQCMQ